MENKFFNKNYSSIYDVIYAQKKYLAEASFISNITQKFFNKNVKILDVGCGTGGHTIELIKKGYKVTGIDISKEMLNVAKKKLVSKNLYTNNLFQLDALETSKLKHKFDVVIMMFNVIGYLNNTKKFFKSLQSSLKPNAIIIFDYWSEKSIRANPPRPKIKNYSKKGLKITRTSMGKIFKNKVEVKIQLLIDDDKKIKKFDEIHNVRFLNIKNLILSIKNFGYKKKNFGYKNFENLIKSQSSWEKICLLSYEEKN